MVHAPRCRFSCGIRRKIDKQKNTAPWSNPLRIFLQQICSAAAANFRISTVCRFSVGFSCSISVGKTASWSVLCRKSCSKSAPWSILCGFSRGFSCGFSECNTASWSYPFGFSDGIHRKYCTVEHHHLHKTLRLCLSHKLMSNSNIAFSCCEIQTNRMKCANC